MIFYIMLKSDLKFTGRGMNFLHLRQFSLFINRNKNLCYGSGKDQSQDSRKDNVSDSKTNNKSSNLSTNDDDQRLNSRKLVKMRNRAKVIPEKSKQQSI